MRKLNSVYKHGWIGTLIEVMVTIGIAIILMIEWGIHTHKANMSKEKSQMSAYLQDKYNQQFVVNDPKETAATIGIDGYMEATAHPEGDNTTVFYVRSSSTNTWDTYPDVVWTQEETPAVKTELQQTFSTIPKYNFSIGSYEARNEIEGNLPLIGDALKQYGKQIGYDLRVESNVTDRAQNVEIAKKLVEFLASKNANASLGFAYNKATTSLSKKDIDDIQTGTKDIQSYIK